MATLHFEGNPYRRDLFNISEEEVQGQFPGWQKNARYNVDVTVVLAVDTTNVSPGEYRIAPNITFLATNRAIIHVYKSWEYVGSFPNFQNYYAKMEMTLNRYIDDLANRLNAARRQSGGIGSWYIDYSLNDRKIEVHKA